jgi:predicted RNA binding protein YcfA (HicA-like mRNA interferase family)
MVPYAVLSIKTMTKKILKLYNKLKESPTNASYDEVCQLAEKAGFVFRKQNGSHKIYKHPIYQRIMNFQPDKNDKSKAKKYQVSQLIDFIDNNELIKEDK